MICTNPYLKLIKGTQLEDRKSYVFLARDKHTLRELRSLKLPSKYPTGQKDIPTSGRTDTRLIATSILLFYSVQVLFEGCI